MHHDSINTASLTEGPYRRYQHYQQQKLNFNRNRLNLFDKSKSVSNLHVNLSIWIDFE